MDWNSWCSLCGNYEMTEEMSQEVTEFVVNSFQVKFVSFHLLTILKFKI